MVIIGRILGRFTAIYPIITTELQVFWKAKRAGVGPKRHNAARQPCAALAVGYGRLIVSSEHHRLKNYGKNQIKEIGLCAQAKSMSTTFFCKRVKNHKTKLNTYTISPAAFLYDKR
jgi:hypothetical protein